MASKVGERLEELAAFLAHQHALDSVEETLGHLQTEITDAMVRSRASAQRCTILLFQSAEPPSLLHFLAASADFTDDARKREISAARGSVLELLASFLKAYGAHRALTKQHVVDMYRTCQQTARTDPFNRVKAHALEVVVNVLKYAGTRVSKDEIEPRAYVDKLFYDIKFSKATQTAKGQMLEVIGYLVEKFPQDMEDAAAPLLGWSEDALEKQFSSNAPEMMMVNGLLFALARLLECDPDRYKRDEGLRKKIYSYLLAVFATTVSGNLSRYQVTNSSEIFLAKHAQLFQQEIGPNGYVWFTYMKFCCMSENKTVKEHAFVCSNAIFQTLNSYVVKTKDDSRKKCLNKILKEVLPIISDSGAGTSMMAFAVQCLGWLARSIYVYLGAKGYGKIEDKLKTFGETLLALDTKATAWRWPLVSQYVQCLGHFVQERGDVPLDEGYVKFIGDVLCHLMTAYPQCLWKSKVMIHKSVIMIFAALAKWTVIDSLVDRFVLHTLMLSISNATDPDQAVVYHPDTGELVTNLLYDYEDFWLALLRRRTNMLEETTSGSDDVDMKEPTDSQRTLPAILFDSTVKNVVDIVNQLNLSYQFDLQTTNNGKNATGYTPTVPRDHSIMLNLTEFVERVLGKTPRSLLHPWIFPLMQQVFVLSSKLPLVSCFYRIATVLVTAMDDLKYFDAPPYFGGYNADRQARFRHDLTQFLQWVCAQARFYQEELLLTSAKFVLAAPIGLAAPQTLIYIVRSILELGRSYLPAAIVAVTVLERWKSECPDKLEEVISEIVPLLAAYLDQEEFCDEDLSLVKTKGKSRSTSGSSAESDLSQLQRRILLLLGKCGGKISLLISEPPSTVNAGGSMGSISSPFFQLELQLSEMPLSLAMDPILSHLGDLASRSSVRRVKASACEGYHALVCYLCGKTTTHPHGAGKKTVFFDLWRGIFARVVRLATDPEKICRSLFEPLLFQLLRWLASNSDTFPFEYAGMLDELTRSLSDPVTAIRTMSARSIASLLSLALEEKSAQVKVEDIFERVFSLCRHPGAIQRSGAAASISYFLRSVNDEDGAVLTKFALPCLKNLLYAVRLCHSDARNKTDVSRDVISKAVTKIERGICRFSQLFMKEKTTSRQVALIEEDSILQHMTTWLFQQVGAREVLYRRLCRQLFMSFSALVCTSSSEWIDHYASTHGKEAITAVLTPMSSLVHALPNLTVEWLEQLSASLESYVWCVKLLGTKSEGIFKPEPVSFRKESIKRKHTSDTADATESNCQQPLSWAIAIFLKQESPWDNLSVGTHWIDTYASVLASLCNFIKSFMLCDSASIRNIIDVDTQSFRFAVAEKLAQALLHRPDTWANDSSSFDDIEDFCAGVVVRSQDWANQLQKTVDALLSTLQTCLADVNSSESFANHTRTIQSLTFFGSKALKIHLISFPEADKHAPTFALVAKKTMQYGQCLPDSYTMVVMALQAATSCGWRIADIFVNPSDRHVYGPVYNNVVRFIPTLAVWKRCASDLVSLSLENDYAVNVLADVVHEVTSGKVYSARSTEWDAFAKTLVVHIKQFIKNLEVVKADTQRTLSLLHVLRYFLELCKQCSENLIEVARIGPVPDIRDAIIDLLKQRECSYMVKAEILQMLSLMGPTSSLVTDAQHGSSQILESLVAFVFDEFPIVSTDVSHGTKDFDVFHLLFVELLGAIERSNSVAYLKIIYPSLKEAGKHIFNAEIKQMLARFSISLGDSVLPGDRDSTDRVRLQLGELLDVLLDPTLEVAIRKTLLEEVFTPLIECQTGATLLQFYLMDSTTRKSTIMGVLAALLSTSAETTSGGSRIGVFVAFSLVELMYRLMDPEVVRTDINSAFLGHKNGKGREFTMLVCKCASKVVTKAYGDSDELTRLACCAAYSCLLTAVSRTQKQEKFFDQILFQPALWGNILDPLRGYELRAETEQLVTIPLSSLSAISLQVHIGSTAVGNTKVKRNESAALQFFTASSLSVDADTLGSMTVPFDMDQAAADYQNVEIELDDLNQHPCMIPLLRVLVQMKTDFGSTWVEKAQPAWMKKIFDVIANPSTGLNVRLFLGKVVLNIPEVFEMYASCWLPAVMETLLDATEAQKVPEFNYLLRDCCNLMLNSWKNITISPSTTTANRFINELIKLSPHRNNLIRDSNLLLVTELIALWKDSVSIDTSLLTTYFNSDEEDARMKSSKQFTALQIVSALMNSGLAASLTCEDEGQTVEDGILLVMKSKATSLYTLAAEVGGLFSQFADQSHSEEFMCKLQNLIIGSYNDEDFGRFLALLRNASMHHPEIIDSAMLQRLSFVLPKTISVDTWAMLAAESLSNAAGNEHVANDIFAHVQSVLGRFLAHRHAGVQQNTLRAVLRLLDHLTTSEMERLVAKPSEGGLSMLEYFETHEVSECRELIFNVAKKMYEKDVSPQVKDRLKASLLHGLCDPDDLLRKEAFEYWNNSDCMMRSCSDRLLAIFGSMYSQEFDDKWVFYATNLLLGMSKESDAFEQPLFSSALGGAEYTETNIDATWEATTQSMAPLFSVEADTFSVRQSPTQQTPNAVSSQLVGSVGSTMQSQIITSISQMPELTSRTPSQNVGELVGLQQQSGRKRFSKRRTTAENSSVKDPSNYDKKASKRYFQDQYALQKKQEEAQVTRERKQRQGLVSIKRRYRVGEFPDIQISQQDIVDPITALCEVHAETSSLVFGALFSSIVTTSQFEQSGNASQLAERLEKTLALSKASPVYVGCVTSAYFASIVKKPGLGEILAVSANTVGEAGLSSGMYHLSELTLEEQLIYRIQHNDRGLDSSSHEIVSTSWDLLHKLLSTVHKRNFLIALSMACSTTDESKLALQAQLAGDLPLAIASYKKAESMLTSQMEILDGGSSFAIEADATRCRWQRFNCLETLNNWDTLNNELADLIKEDSDFLWKQRAPYLEQGVGHYMRSCLGLVERSDSTEVTTGLRSFLKDATHDSMKHGLTQSKFPVEVCMSYLSMGDKNQARVSVETFYSTFLKIWRQTSSMASSSRLELMQSLSSIVEIDEVLLHFGGDSQNLGKQEYADTMEFIGAWRRSPPLTGEDGMILWSQHAMVQNTIASLLLDYAQAEGNLSDEMRSAVLGIKSNVMLQYASAAISCNILALASKMLKSYRELCNAHHLPKLSVQMVEVFVSHVLRLVDRQEHQSGKDGLNPTAVKLITRYYETATKMFDNVEIINMMETANVSDQVAMGYLEAKSFASAAGFYALYDVDDSLKEEYYSRSLDMFKVSCERIASTGDSNEQRTSAAFLRCRLTFIEFLNDLLFKRKMEKLSKLSDRKTLVKLLAENILRGMEAGDRECAHYFPQICDMIAPYPDLVAAFEQHVLAQIPLWTCLQWSAQLMALLNGPIGRTIVAILEKMAEKYPVALFYDFMVTCKSSLKSFKVDLHRLEVLLTNSVMEKFVAALRLIHHPEIRLKEGLREIAKLLEENRTSDAKHKVGLLWKDCFLPDRPLLGAQIGRYNRDWSRKAKRDVEKIMGKDGSKMTAKSVNTAREWIMNHFSVTPGRYGITKDMKAHLGDFAEWLEEFDHSSCSLELPGQYTAYWGPPDPSTHIRILSFDSMLGVLASKQLPKRLTLHCSDEKDYTFLVKGGEDLRLDQRIEQLFGVMNQILEAGPRCRDQRLSLVTYNVVPMTQEIGILEWVDGTSTLKGVIESQLQIDDRCTDLKSNKRQKLDLFNTTAAKSYETFLMKQRGASFSAKVVAPRSKDVVEQFAKVQAMIPGDLLRRQLLGLGSNFEAFLLVRDRFLKSLAVFNACSYVLGIGDRHLDNFLFDLSNGCVIGIDFGVSFGAGASILPVPELIPFRYTRQMDFVFQPYDGANLLAQEMQAVFDALRAKRQVVESVMNVFLHEPLLDWQQSTTTHQKALFEVAEGDDRPTLQNSDVDMEDVEEVTPTRVSRSGKKSTASPAGPTATTAWLPDVKIAIARRKLEGVSPGLLLKEELSQNVHLKQHISKFHALVDAASRSENDTHEMAAMSSLSQAQELLAMATAPDLLGRTFQGWMPWL